MIKNVFLPSHIGDYYLFSQRFIGIDIGRTAITATVANAHGSIVTIEKTLMQPIDQSKTGNERIVEALLSLKEKLPLPAQIRTSLPSANVVFKELTLPFSTYQKLNLVVRFEVEPLLPFPIQDAIVDFIITKHHDTSSQILVAAAQKQQIAQHLSLFEQAGLLVDTITVDLFDIYGMYTQIPSYAALPGTNVLLDITSQNTRLACIIHGQLRVIRTLPFGSLSLAKEIAQTTNQTPQQVIDLMVKSEPKKDSEFAKALQNALGAYWNRMQFALTSLSAQLPEAATINHIFLLGSGAQITGIDSFIHKQSGIPTSLFNALKLKENKRYVFKTDAVTTKDAQSIAATIQTPIMQNFNLCKEEFRISNTKLLFQQIFVAISLLFIVFGSLLTHTIIQTRKLNNEIISSEQEAIDAIKEHFPDLPEDVDDLDEITQAAKESLESQEATWMAFSAQSRASFLEYLLELSTRINKHELGFVPEQLSIVDGAKGEISLKARVRDYEALKQLEQALRQSKLFSYVEGQTTPDFTMKILIGDKRGL